MDLGDSSQGLVIGAHNEGGRLIVKPFEDADYDATKEYFNPDKYKSLFLPDYDTELDSVAVCDSSKSDTELINDILKAINNYIRNESKNNISYPIAGAGVNSNSWAQSVIEFVGGSVRENFRGADIFSGSRVDNDYFR